MAKLFGKNLSRADLLRRIGNVNQIGGIREYTYNSGRAAGTRAIEINTGVLSLEIMVDRCLDISHGSYLGIPFGYFSKSGIRHPAYYSKIDPTGFQDNFYAGVLSTCGLHNIGPASHAEGRDYQLHGIAGNIPAEKISVKETWDGDDLIFSVEGEIHHSSFYQEDLIIHRRISARLGDSFCRIDDRVENLDFAPSTCLMLYHAQFGFPFLSENTKLLTSPVEKSVARPGVPEAETARCGVFAPPKDGQEEYCFYHTLKPGADGLAGAALFNPDLGEDGLGVFVKYDTKTLPRMVQWKMLRSREYVCGLEPTSASLENRSAEELAALALRPLEKREFHLQIGVLPGEAALKKHLA